MKFIYIAAALVLLYALISYARVVLVLRTNALPAIVQQDAVLGSGQPLTYVAAGDSTSVGVGASDLSKSYSYKVFQALATTNQVQYKHVGKSGAQTTDFMSEQLPKIIQANPDIVTISIGANDVTHLKSTASVIDHYKTIIDELTTQTHAQLYLTNIPILKDAPLLPWPYRKLLEYKSRAINKELQALETERVHVVPIYTFGWDQFSDIRTTFAQDQFHPSDVGYENWTNAFLTTMRK